MSKAPDEKLNELIEAYGFQILDKGGLCTNDVCLDILNAKQAIIDYHDKKVGEAIALIKEERD